jgi:hypothetical protein
MPAFSPKIPRLLLPNCRPVYIGRVAASPFSLQLLEGAPPGHDGPKGVFSQVCRADLQADYFC